MMGGGGLMTPPITEGSKKATSNRVRTDTGFQNREHHHTVNIKACKREGLSLVGISTLKISRVFRKVSGKCLRASVARPCWTNITQDSPHHSSAVFDSKLEFEPKAFLLDIYCPLVA